MPCLVDHFQAENCWELVAAGLHVHDGTKTRLCETRRFIGARAVLMVSVHQTLLACVALQQQVCRFVIYVFFSSFFSCLIFASRSRLELENSGFSGYFDPTSVLWIDADTFNDDFCSKLAHFNQRIITFAPVTKLEQ